jgi:hypothetical protein
VYAAGGVRWSSTSPALNRSSVATDDASIACFFRWWFTIDPNHTPDAMVITRNTPPSVEVEMTERVVRYAQNVRANHTKLLVVTTRSVTPSSL